MSQRSIGEDSGGITTVCVPPYSGVKLDLSQRPMEGGGTDPNSVWKEIASKISEGPVRIETNPVACPRNPIVSTLLLQYEIGRLVQEGVLSSHRFSHFSSLLGYGDKSLTLAEQLEPRPNLDAPVTRAETSLQELSKSISDVVRLLKTFPAYPKIDQWIRTQAAEGDVAAAKDAVNRAREAAEKIKAQGVINPEARFGEEALSDVERAKQWLARCEKLLQEISPS